MRLLTSGLLAAIALLTMLVATLPASPAAAHPLGNFSINEYTRLDVSASGIEAFHVLDMAEIPALQEWQAIDTNNDDSVNASESAAYASAKAEELSRQLHLLVDGAQVPFVELLHELTFPEGEGGLKLLRLEVTYRTDLREGWSNTSPQVEFSNSTNRSRVGWHEIVVRGGPGVEILGSNASTESITDELRSFPEEIIGSPVDQYSASFQVQPGVGTPFPETHPKQAEAVRGNPDGELSRFADLIARDNLTPGVITIALLAAVVFGALHALSPGHGKTVVAAYLVGSRGTAAHALLLGFVVTATHTSTVYLVGFVALYFSQYILPEDLYPWLGVASGALILVMGFALLTSRLRASGLLDQAVAWFRARTSAQPQRVVAFAASSAMALPKSGVSRGSCQHAADEPHDDHGDHRHDGAPHSHGFGPAHSHRIPGQDGEPVTLRSLVGLGVFGGMIPCPSAIVVMLSAIALHRVAFGLVLIVAFSLGLAVVLVAIGFAFVFARSLTERVPVLASLSQRIDGGVWQSALVRAIPVAAAGAVIVAGLIITLRATAQQGWF